MTNTRRASRLLIIGADILFLTSILIAVLIYSFVLGGFGQQPYGLLAPFLRNFYFDLWLYLGISFVFTTIIIIGALKLRSKLDSVSAKWAIMLIPLFIGYFAVQMALPQMLFGSVSFASSFTLSGFSIIHSYASSGLYTQANFWTNVLSATFFVPLFAGGVVGFIGLAYAIDRRQKKRAANHAMISILVLLFLVIASAFITSYTNTKALTQLNMKIDVYGANVKYLLANQTVFNTVFKNQNGSEQGQIAMYLSENRSFSDLLPNFLNGPSINNVEYHGSDWGAYNPIVRALDLGAQFSLGIPVNYTKQQGAPSYINSSMPATGLLTPVRASNLQSLYDLGSSGTIILGTAGVLGNLFSCGAFNPNNTTHYISGYSGVAISQAVPQIGSDVISTSTLVPSKGDVYSSLSGLPIGWMLLMFGTNGQFPKIMQSGYLECGNSNRISIGQFFYMLSLNQYEGYSFSQNFYNTSISPAVDFVGYQGNYLLVNLGNLNLNSPGSIVLNVDGKSVAYTRYYNYLLAGNLSLQPGSHAVNVLINGVSLENESSNQETLYVSPGLEVYYYRIAGGAFNARIYNPLNSTVTLNRVSLSSTPPNGFSGWVPNYGGLSLAYQLPSVMLSPNETVWLNTTVARCSIGQPFSAFLTFNSSLGSGLYIMNGKCT